MTERLQNHDRLRRDLMADVAHELRTPLTVIQGKLEGLLDGVYPPDQRQLGVLVEETHVLSRLIEDLRTVALSEGGALKLLKESADVDALARDVVHAFEDEAGERGVILRIAAPEQGSLRFSNRRSIGASAGAEQPAGERPPAHAVRGRSTFAYTSRVPARQRDCR
jgi:signal transduction histidine kinase